MPSQSRPAAPPISPLPQDGKGAERAGARCGTDPHATDAQAASAGGAADGAKAEWERRIEEEAAEGAVEEKIGVSSAVTIFSSSAGVGGRPQRVAGERGRSQVSLACRQDSAGTRGSCAVIHRSGLGRTTLATDLSPQQWSPPGATDTRASREPSCDAIPAPKAQGCPLTKQGRALSPPSATSGC